MKEAKSLYFMQENIVVKKSGRLTISRRKNGWLLFHELYTRVLDRRAEDLVAEAESQLSEN